MDSSAEKKLFLIRPHPEAEGYDTNPLPETDELRDQTVSSVNNEAITKKKTVIEVALDDIAPSPFQTRDVFEEDALSDLKNSIAVHGIIQPILVREIALDSPSEKSYELIAGERRFRAAQLAGLKRIPAIICEVADQESVQLLIVENAQREGLNAYEEAKAYEQLSSSHKLSHAEIARTVGKNRATITNSLRLLQLQPEVLELLKSGQLSAGHGRALLSIEVPSTQLRMAQIAVSRGLSVRALEGMIVELLTEEAESVAPEKAGAEPDFSRTLSKISSYLGVEEIKLRENSHGHKQLSITFPSEAAWKRFMGKIRE